MRRTVSIVSPSAQKCIDNFPPILLLSVPRDNGLVAQKTGCLLSLKIIIINSATLSHSPCGLISWVKYHCFPDRSLRNDQRPAGNLFASCNVANPGKIFQSNSVGSPSIVSKVLYCGESLIQLNCSSQTAFDCGSSFIFPRHNTASAST